ncbi:Carnosine synthase 1, partial [Perkinsus chesapeaki]
FVSDPSSKGVVMTTASHTYLPTTIEGNAMKRNTESSISRSTMAGDSSQDDLSIWSLSPRSCSAYKSKVTNSVENILHSYVAGANGIPWDVLTADSLQGQRLRESLLSDTCIVFFNAGYRGKRFIYEKARELGVKTVIIDSPCSWASELVTEGVITSFIGLDMGQGDDAIFEASVEALRSFEMTSGITIDGICTVIELAVPMVARLTEAFSLPGPQPCHVDAARDKYKTREALEKHGLPRTTHVLISREDEIEAAAAKVGYPAVMKPISGAASLGVKKVNSHVELLSVYRETQQLLSELVVSSGALERRNEHSDSDAVAASGRISSAVMLEEYLDGHEVDVDVILSPGLGCTFAVVTDNAPTKEPYFSETWGVLPSALSQEHCDELKDLAINSVKALGFDSGVFHVEAKYTSRGPRLIEVNARMGGGPVHLCHKMTSGVELSVEVMLLAVGLPSRPFQRNISVVGFGNVNSPKSGVIYDFSFLSKWQNVDGCEMKYCIPMVSPGDHIVGPEDGQPCWVVDFMFVCDCPSKAAEISKRLDDELSEEVGKQINLQSINMKRH